MAQARDFSERSGLDYLIKAGRVAPPETVPQLSHEPIGKPAAGSELGSILQAFGARAMLQAIDRLAPRAATGVRLSAVAEETDMTADVLLSLTRYLESLDLLRVVETAAFGDYLVSLSSRGLSLAQDRNLDRVFQVLGLYK